MPPFFVEVLSMDNFFELEQRYQGNTITQDVSPDDGFFGPISRGWDELTSSIGNALGGFIDYAGETANGIITDRLDYERARNRNEYFNDLNPDQDTSVVNEQSEGQYQQTVDRALNGYLTPTNIAIGSAVILGVVLLLRK